MAHESCKSQIAVLEMNGQSVPQCTLECCLLILPSYAILKG